MKIAINNCIGGFCLSEKAILRLAELYGFTPHFYRSEIENGKLVHIKIPKYEDEMTVVTKIDCGEKCENGVDPQYVFRKIQRNDAFLIQIIEELGDEASEYDSSIQIIEIPDDVDWEIESGMGIEAVREKSRVWQCTRETPSRREREQSQS